MQQRLQGAFQSTAPCAPVSHCMPLLHSTMRPSQAQSRTVVRSTSIALCRAAQCHDSTCQLEPNGVLSLSYNSVPPERRSLVLASQRQGDSLVRTLRI